MRTWRDADRPWAAHIFVLRLKGQVVVQDHDSRVAAIGNINVALAVRCDRMWRVELVGPGTALTRILPDEPAVLVVLHDAGIDVAVGDEDVALRIPRHVG